MRPPRSPGAGRQRGATALLLLLLCFSGLPVAQGLNALDQQVPVPAAPQTPPPQLPATHVPAVDSAGGFVMAQAAQVVTWAGQNYTAAVAKINQTQSSTLQQPIALYADGIGDDPHTVRLTEWSQLGDATWRIDPKAAATGAQGYTVAGPDGTYEGDRRSLLLSPQLDLDTGIETPLKQADSRLSILDPTLIGQGQGPHPGLSMSAVWSLLFGNFTAGKSGVTCVTAPFYVDCGQGSQPLPSSTALFKLRFNARHNLGARDEAKCATGQLPQRATSPCHDGVAVLVFDSEAAARQVLTKGDLSACQRYKPVEPAMHQNPTPCTEVILAQETQPPALADHYESIDALRDEGGRQHPGFSGYQDWATYALDLTPWAGRTVQVGFYFASDPVPNRNYFRTPAYFSQDAGFLGFQLDDLLLTAPGPISSMHVRPLSAPAQTPPGSRILDGAAVPTVAPDQPFDVTGHVLNTGMTNMSVDVSISVTAPAGATTTHTIRGAPLPPGGTLTARFPFTVPAGEGYVATVSAARSCAVASPAGAATCVPDPCVPACGTSSGDLESGTGAAQTTFDARELRWVEPGQVTRSSGTIHAGGSVTFSLPLRNLGDVAQSVSAQACVVDLLAVGPDGSPAPACVLDPTALPDLLDDGGRHGRLDVTLAPAGKPGDTAMLQWRVLAGPPGQYLLHLRMSDPAGFATLQPFAPGDLTALRQPQLRGDPFRLYELTPGFGVDRGPPPILQADFAAGECPAIGTSGLTGWVRSNEESRDTRTERWTCGMYAPAGLPLLYEGVDPSVSQCDPSPCQPYSALRGSQGEGVSNTQLLSPAFKVPDVARPYLYLDHQFATETWIADATGDTESGYVGLGTFGGLHAHPSVKHGLYVQSRGQVQVQVNPAELLPTAGPVSPWSSTGGHFATTSQSGAILNVPLTAAPSDYSDLVRSVRVKALFSVKAPSSGAGLKVEACILASCALSGTFGQGQLDQELVRPGGGAWTWEDLRYLALRFTATGTSASWVVDAVAVAAHGQQIPIDPDPSADDRGYTSEAQVGIADARDGDRASGQFPNVDKPCGKDPGYLTGYAMHGVKGCGFWWPTGWQPLYRPADQAEATGGNFSGSPWMLTRIPLFGTHMTGYDVPKSDTTDEGVPHFEELEHLRGKTVRIVLDFDRSAAPKDAVPARDYGWRVAGLAVTEDGALQRGVALEDMRVDAPLFDPASIGVAPGSLVNVTLTVLNNGQSPVGGLSAQLTGTEPTGTLLCGPTADEGHAEADLNPRIAPGERFEMTLGCRVPSNLPTGTLLSLQASVFPDGGDDFPSDNHLAVRQPLRVASTPRVAVVAQASPKQGPPTLARTLSFFVENQGNVPLTAFGIKARVERPDGTILRELPSWCFAGTLGVGQSVPISSATLHATPSIAADALRYPPAGLLAPGQYVVAAEASLSCGGASSTPPSLAAFESAAAAYGNDFRFAPTADAAVVAAPAIHPESPWALKGQQLVAGVDGLLPPLTDASVLLPPMNLTTMRTASLSLVHRYDLEPSFDAGRLEISSDDGQTWRPLRPEPDAAIGLPQGYPEGPLQGTSPFLDGQPNRTATAFTGRSGDLSGVGAGGWVASTFDLAKDPGLQRATTVAVFDLQHPAARPSELTDGVQFTDPSWATANGRWWVDNSTFDLAPHADERMWWSGSAGKEGGRLLDDTLSVPLALPSLTSVAPADHLLLSWWDWRPGTGDGDAAQALGTGGNFTVLIDGAAQASRVVRAEANGRTQREVDVTAHAGSTIHVAFHYQSLLTTKDRRPLLQANLGWFVDDLNLLSSRATVGQAPPEAVVTALPVEAAAWTTDGGWKRIRQGEAATEGGWHADAQSIPSVGQVDAWSFSSASPQGYPEGADSRLVTPVVDLGSVGQAHLQFQQRYDFESRMKCPNLRASSCNQPGSFTSAVDGGAVEVQVYNQTTRTFGPWMQIGAQFRDFPERLFLDAQETPAFVYVDNHGSDVGCPSQLSVGNYGSEATCWARQVDRLSDVFQGGMPNRDLLAQTGYSAIEERGSDAFGVPTSGQERLQTTPAGHGTSFEVHDGMVRRAWNGWRTYGWTPYPVSYVFSGASNGWHALDWDIGPLAGQQVRFGFHAVSNPSLTQVPAPTDGSPAYGGWSIAQVSVRGQAFEGKPVQVRLRVATDGSVERDQWVIGGVALAGQRFHGQVSLLPTTPLQVEAPTGSVVLAGRAANLGALPENGIALVVRAEDPVSGKSLPFHVTTMPPRGAPDPASIPQATEALRSGRAQAWAAFDLAPPGTTGAQDSLPFTITLDDAAGAARVHAQLFQSNGRTTTSSNGQEVPLYETAPWDEPGAAQLDWSVEAHDVRRLEPLRPISGSPAVAVAVPQQDGSFLLQAQARNAGTVAVPAAAIWSVQEVVRRTAGTGDQQGIAEQDGAPQPLSGTDFGTLAPGQVAPTTTTFAPTHAGLYRATLLLDPGAVRVSVEFASGLPGRALANDFSRPADAANWTVRPSGAKLDATPPQVAFRTEGDRILWGANDTQLLAGQNYCSFDVTGGCNYLSGFGVDRRGLEGILDGPIVDLRRVPQGQASAAMSALASFEVGDGARLEAIPLLDGGAAAFTCPASMNSDQAADQDMAFAVPMAFPTRTVRSLPSVPTASGARSGVMQQPLDPDPAWTPVPALGATGTPVAWSDLRFPLDQPVASVCAGPGGPVTTHLMGYRVRLRLHVGTQPGVTDQSPRAGDVGLRVAKVDVGSSAVALAPAVASYPVQPGTSKAFSLRLTNQGPAMDRFGLQVGAGVAFPLDWVQLPAPITLAPGESRLVQMLLAVPTEAAISAGNYPFTILAKSTLTPEAAAQASATLQLLPLNLPDLNVGPVSTDAPEGIPVDQDVRVFATITNVGNLVSLPVVAQLRVNGTVVDTAQVPALCPLQGSCPTGTATQAPLAFQWVPERVGDVDLTVVVDPGASAASEASLTNNQGVLHAVVVPQSLPYVTVTRLAIDGVGPDGGVEGGRTLRLHADVSNLGYAPAVDVQAGLELGSNLLISPVLHFLAPGQTVTLHANSSAAPGDPILTAFVAAAANGDLHPLLGKSLSRTLHVRSHAIRLEPEGATKFTASAGDTLTALVGVNNTGNSVEQVLLCPTTVTSGWGFAVSPDPVAVAPHTRTVAVLTIQVPASAPAGANRVMVEGTLGGVEGIPVLGLPLNVTVGARDGAPRLAAEDATAAPGQTPIHLSVIAGGNTAQKLTLRLASPAWAAAPRLVQVPAAGVAWADVLVEVPAQAAAGPHELSFEARDAANHTVAQASAVLTVLPNPAVQAAWQGTSPSSAPAAGSRRVVLHLAVNNTGNVPVDVSAMLLDLGDGLAADAGPGSNVSALAPGAATILDLPITLDGTALPGIYGRAEVWVSQTGAGSTAFLAQSMQIPGLLEAPDLHLVRVDVVPHGELRPGDVAHLVAVVRNDGSRDAPASLVSAFVDGDLLDDLALPALAPGAQATVQLNLTFSAAGAHVLHVQVDGGGVVQEMERGNNGGAREVTVVPGLVHGLPAPAAALCLCLLLLLAGVRRRSRVAREVRA